MSWTDIFPVLDDEMLAAYQAGVSDEEWAEFEGWFGVMRQEIKTEAARDKEMLRGMTHRLTGLESNNCESPARKHIVSATLFWKHVNGRDPDLPRPTREMLVDAKRMGLVKRFAPWDSYIAPLFLHSRAAMDRHPEVTFRLYLANDLEFLRHNREFSGEGQTGCGARF